MILMCVYRPGVRKRQSSGKGGISLPPAKFRLGSIGSRGGEVKYQSVIKKEVLWLGVPCLRFRNSKLFSSTLIDTPGNRLEMSAK